MLKSIIRYRFQAYERLKGKKIIAKLFQEGHVVKKFYPLQLVYLAVKDPAITHHKVLCSVSKKKCKHAVDRNRIKRKMREAYRLNKHCLLPSASTTPMHHFLLAYLYVAQDSNCDFETIEKKIQESIDYLNQLADAGVDSSIC